MKVNISIDMTPEEFRKMMGWPDVQGLHEDIMGKMREQIAAGAEGYDPMSLMQPYIKQSLDSMGGFQKMMAGMAETYFTQGSGDKEK
ncbi:MAG: hypothetical protein C0631_08760 [Sedimenticola sp.]|jgi:hypothetical protein|nr:MAG: hypothetical protein C0631_08760 [Sedimenticola sp.]